MNTVNYGTTMLHVAGATCPSLFIVAASEPFSSMCISVNVPGLTVTKLLAMNSMLLQVRVAQSTKSQLRSDAAA